MAMTYMRSIEVRLQLGGRQLEVYRKLSDGMFHDRRDIIRHIGLGDDPNEYTDKTYNLLQVHINILRRKLRTVGLTVGMLRQDNQTYYRISRLMDIN